jgi:hypothetical protein
MRICCNWQIDVAGPFEFFLHKLAIFKGKLLRSFNQLRKDLECSQTKIPLTFPVLNLEATAIFERKFYGGTCFVFDIAFTAPDISDGNLEVSLFLVRFVANKETDGVVCGEYASLELHLATNEHY